MPLDEATAVESTLFPDWEGYIYIDLASAYSLHSM